MTALNNLLPESQMKALDKDTTQRITQLIEESQISPDLALQAIQEANRQLADLRPSDIAIKQSTPRLQNLIAYMRDRIARIIELFSRQKMP